MRTIALHILPLELSVCRPLHLLNKIERAIIRIIIVVSTKTPPITPPATMMIDSLLLLPLSPVLLLVVLVPRRASVPVATSPSVKKKKTLGRVNRECVQIQN